MTNASTLMKMLEPGAPLTEADLVSFLQLRIPEGLRVEYKSKLSDESTIHAIAAMANTAGGLVLIGVEEDEKTKLPLPNPPGVTLAGRDALTRQMFDRLEPTLDLDIEVVELASTGRYVIVIRIDERRIDRPVVVKGRVYVRIEGHSVPATRQQLLGLVNARSSPTPLVYGTGVGHNFSSRNGSFSIVESSTPGLTARVVFGAAVPRWESAGTLGSEARRKFLVDVQGSDMERWIGKTTIRDDANWRLAGAWTSAAVAVARRERVGSLTDGWDIDAQAVLELPQYGGSGGVILVYLDLALIPSIAPSIGEPQPQTMIEAPETRFGFTIESLYELTDTLLVSAVNMGQAVFPGILGDDWRSATGPRLTFDTWPTTLDKYVDFGRFPRAADARDHSGTTIEAMATDDFSDPATRERVLRDWLELLYLNHGYLDFEDSIARLRT
jgi:hypothetical protein